MDNWECHLCQRRVCVYLMTIERYIPFMRETTMHDLFTFLFAFILLVDPLTCPPEPGRRVSMP
jgi:hypothetical protein